VDVFLPNLLKVDIAIVMCDRILHLARGCHGDDRMGKKHCDSPRFLCLTSSPKGKKAPSG
jgi:hypothetical protein